MYTYGYTQLSIYSQKFKVYDYVFTKSDDTDAKGYEITKFKYTQK